METVSVRASRKDIFYLMEEVLGVVLLAVEPFISESYKHMQT